ncbi:hypothetical protein [Streptomyces sp. NPDC020362]|uniref:hypothetical protein n=1 Tax=unclassified Streptomyces TaxID=2593676 RepID=UPI0033FE1821
MNPREVESNPPEVSEQAHCACAAHRFHAHGTPHGPRLRIREITQFTTGVYGNARIYRAPVPTRNRPMAGGQADPRLSRPGNAGGILAIEDNRWHVSLMGAPGGYTLRPLLGHAEPLTDVSLTHSTANRRYHYERLSHWPEGLMAVGDSAAVFNPVYAQGISVAAQGALALRDLLAKGVVPGLARRAQRAIARPIDNAWVLATGQDIHFSATKGKSPNLADRLLHRYVSRLSRTATVSFHAATALTDVLALQAPPITLVKPRVLLTALLGPLRPPLDRPRFTPAERRLLNSLDRPAGAPGRGTPS